jgi:hypothetical protein
MKTALVVIGILVAIGLGVAALIVNLNKPGIQGIQGEQGIGISSIDHRNGDLIIYTSDGIKYVLGGVDGKDGVNGVGINGKDGKNGTNGKDGLNGKDGIGVTGTNGANGKDGKDGLSIVGAQGSQGIAGTNGKNGVSVIGARIDCSGHLILGMSDGTTIDAGQLP